MFVLESISLQQTKNVVSQLCITLFLEKIFSAPVKLNHQDAPKARGLALDQQQAAAATGWVWLRDGGTCGQGSGQPHLVHLPTRAERGGGKELRPSGAQQERPRSEAGERQLAAQLLPKQGAGVRALGRCGKLGLRGHVGHVWNQSKQLSSWQRFSSCCWQTHAMWVMLAELLGSFSWLLTMSAVPSTRVCIHRPPVANLVFSLV